MVFSCGVVRNAKTDSLGIFLHVLNLEKSLGQNCEKVWLFSSLDCSIKGTSAFYSSFNECKLPSRIRRNTKLLELLFNLVIRSNLALGFLVGFHVDSMVLMSSWTLMSLCVVPFEWRCVSISIRVQFVKPNSLLCQLASHFGLVAWLI